MERAAELRQRFDLTPAAHFRIAPSQMIENQLLAGHFPRRHVLHILGSQPRRRFERFEGLVLSLFPLQLQPPGKRLASFFYFSFRWNAGGSARRTFRTRYEGCVDRLVVSRRGQSQCDEHKSQPNSEVSPAHVPIVTGKPRRNREFRAVQCTSCIRPSTWARASRSCGSGTGDGFRLQDSPRPKPIRGSVSISTASIWIRECGIIGHEPNRQDDPHRRSFVCPRSSQLRHYASHAPLLKVSHEQWPSKQDETDPPSPRW